MHPLICSTVALALSSSSSSSFWHDETRVRDKLGADNLTPPAALLSQLQLRVRGLATVHQTLNATSHETSIDAKIMLERLVRELAPLTDTHRRRIHVRTDIKSVQLGQDQAVTLAMLAAEALTNAVKYIGGAADATLTLDVFFDWVDDGTLHFCVENTVGSDDQVAAPPADSSGVGSRLMRAFVAQLDGEEVREATDVIYRYSVRFPYVTIKELASAPEPS